MNLKEQHDYYCSDEAWGATAGDRTTTFDSWAAFYAEFGRE